MFFFYFGIPSFFPEMFKFLFKKDDVTNIANDLNYIANDLNYTVENISENSGWMLFKTWRQ